MITIDHILRLHKKSIEVYGGSHGIRDKGLLESAIARPYQAFDNTDLYPDIFQKAAAIMESIIIDGNKRTGFLAMITMLNIHNFKLTATEEDAYDTTIKVSTGKIDLEDLTTWINQHSQSA